MALRWEIPLSFLGLHMDNDGLVQPEGPFEVLHHFLGIMAIHRADVGKSHLLKEHTRHQKIPDGILGTFDAPGNLRSHIGNGHQRIFHIIF